MLTLNCPIQEPEWSWHAGMWRRPKQPCWRWWRNQAALMWWSRNWTWPPWNPSGNLLKSSSGRKTDWMFCWIMQVGIYVVRHHESHIMSEKNYLSFWQIWILQILSFKSIYNLPYFIVRKMQQKSDRKLESCMAQYSFPSVFLAFWALWSPTLYG